jgi:phage terminase small subunit
MMELPGVGLPGLPGVQPDRDEPIGDSLTPKQEFFCLEYVKHWNGARAARTAGYSEHSAGNIACELLTKPHIKRRIRFAKQELHDRTEVTRDELVGHMLKIIRTDSRDIADWGPEHQEKRAKDGALIVSPGVKLIESTELTRDASYAVQEIGNTKEGVKIKLHDKRQAIMDLSRLMGLITDKVDHSGKVETVVTNGPDISKMTDDQLRAWEAFLMASAAIPSTDP